MFYLKEPKIISAVDKFWNFNDRKNQQLDLRLRKWQPTSEEIKSLFTLFSTANPSGEFFIYIDKKSSIKINAQGEIVVILHGQETVARTNFLGPFFDHWHSLEIIVKSELLIVKIDTKEVLEIEMPQGFSLKNIEFDRRTGVVYLDNVVCK